MFVHGISFNCLKLSMGRDGFDELCFEYFFSLADYSSTRGHGLKFRKEYSRLDVTGSFSSRRELSTTGIACQSLCCQCPCF